MKYDVVIIGGGPAGMVTAATAKKFYPDKTVAIIKKEKITMVPCGIPYIFRTLGSVDANVMSTKPVEDAGVEIIVDEVVDIDLNSKVVKTANGKEIGYEKLVFATGSNPVVPRIEGANLGGVFVVSKYSDDLEKLFQAIKNAENVVVVGGGFIGIEISDEISKMGKNVTIVEIMDQLLPAAFDKEFADRAKQELEKSGVRVLLNSKVERIGGNLKVEYVELSDGSKIDADLVVLSVGYRPNVDLAKKAGLKIGESGAIWVDEYMRTSVEDVFAVGDCAEHRDYFTRRIRGLMLASIASFEARIAGANLFKLRVTRINKGYVGVFSTCVGDLTLATAGLTETMAKKEGFEVVVGRATSINRHPGKIPDAKSVEVKLIFSIESGVILGAQIAGGKEVGEMINAVAVALQNNMTAAEIATIQVGTHPLLTPAPTTYPIILAAEDALNKMH